MDLESSLRNLTIVAGGSTTVGIGGYLTGGGHSALSATFGLAADQVLEMDIVTPEGDILTINECQNRDLFWAMRGVRSLLTLSHLPTIFQLTMRTQGGGSTFGVITAATIKAYHSFPFAVASFIIATGTASDAYWSVVASILSQYPILSAQGIAGLPFILPNYTNPVLNITTPVAAYAGNFFIPVLSPSNSSDSITAAVTTVFNNSIAPYPGQFQVTVRPTTYPDFYAWFKNNNGPLDGGFDGLVGSWLLDEKALTTDLEALKEAIKTFTPPGTSSAPYLVSGKGVWDAVPRGGSNAVNPPWRRALMHYSEFRFDFGFWERKKRMRGAAMLTENSE